MSSFDPALYREGYGRHVNSGMARIFGLLGNPIEVASSGNYVHTHDGSSYLDCAGYCVLLFGHGHPHIVSAVRAQLERHAMSSRVLPHAQIVQASMRLASVAPRGLSYVWFGSSGAEVVEAALKLARASGHRRLIAMEGGYHGKSLGALSASGRAHYREPFEPLLRVVRVPFGDIDAVCAALNDSSEPSAVLLEPLQSEAGVLIPPEGYLRAVRSACDRHGAWLLIDEISTGFGRTGCWWRADLEGVVPDVLLAGKALGGGVFPVSALLAAAPAFEPFNREPLLHTSTFSGSPLACAAVQASIDVIESEGLLERARSLGSALLQGISDAAQGCSAVAAVRAAGLLIGIEFVEEHHAADFLLEMLARKVLVSHSLFGHSVARLTPPATLTPLELERIIEAVSHSLRALEARRRHETIR